MKIVILNSLMGNNAATFCTPSSFRKDKTTHKDSHLNYAVCHMKGWRDFMEDTSIHLNNFPKDNHYLFGIFDGHGGPEVAQYVQRHFSIELYLNQHFKKNQYVTALVQTFNKMDHIMQSTPGRKEISNLVQKNISMDNRNQSISEVYAGCTANVCLITDREVFVANAGDSRAVACCKGRAVPLSYDHKPQDKEEYRRIRKAGGFVNHGRVKSALNISRSLGDLQFKKNPSLKASQQMVTSTPDVLKCSREGLEFIIMGCDGIWEQKSNQKMVEWVKQRLEYNMTPQKILQALLDEELAETEEDYYGTDNMSAILIVFNRQ